MYNPTFLSFKDADIPEETKRIYRHNFIGSYFPIDNLESLPLLDSSSSTLLWRPDRIAEAANREARWDVATRRTTKSAFPALWREEHERLGFPLTFVRGLAQLTPTAYRRFEVHLTEGIYRHQDAGLSGPNPSLFDAPPQKNPVYAAIYFRTRDWLKSLPIPSDEDILVAPQPYLVFSVPWSFFTHHWDAFYPDDFTMINIFSFSLGWFLFLDAERFCVFEESPNVKTGLEEANFEENWMLLCKERERAIKDSVEFRKQVLTTL